MPLPPAPGVRKVVPPSEGVTPGEHIAQADWNGSTAQMDHFFLQDAGDSLIEIRRRDLSLQEWRQYDYYGVLTRFDPAIGNPYADQNDSSIEAGFAAEKEIFELNPTKLYGSLKDPSLGSREIAIFSSFFEDWSGWEDVKLVNGGNFLIPSLKCGKRRIPRPGTSLGCGQYFHLHVRCSTYSLPLVTQEDIIKFRLWLWALTYAENWVKDKLKCRNCKKPSGECEIGKLSQYGERK